MKPKIWNVVAKREDGSEFTAQTTGNLPDEAAVKAFYAEHFPRATFVSATETDKPAPVTRKAK